MTLLLGDKLNKKEKRFELPNVGVVRKKCSANTFVRRDEMQILRGEKVKKKINYSRVYCETCNDYHYKYWLDGSEEIIDEEDVDDLLSTGMYYMERKVD